MQKYRRVTTGMRPRCIEYAASFLFLSDLPVLLRESIHNSLSLHQQRNKMRNMPERRKRIKSFRICFPQRMGEQ